MENIFENFVKNCNIGSYSDIEKYQIKTYITEKYGHGFIEELKKHSILHVINFLKICRMENPNEIDFIKEIYLKSSKKFRVQSCDASTTIEEFYHNILKLNVDKNFIVCSEKIYNNLKEGVIVKKEPYNSVFMINIYWICGGVDIDVFGTEKTPYTDNCKQKSMTLYLTTLPKNVKSMVDNVLAYEYIQKNNKKVIYINDFGQKVAYDIL
jgi:hypothetical protein